MSDNRKRKNNALLNLAETLRLSRPEIARRYGCSPQYVSRVLHGHKPCPRKLRLIILGLAAERQIATNELLTKRKGA